MEKIYKIELAKNKEEFDNSNFQPSDNKLYNYDLAISILENYNGGNLVNTITNKNFSVSYNKSKNIWLKTYLKTGILPKNTVKEAKSSLKLSNCFIGIRKNVLFGRCCRVLNYGTTKNFLVENNIYDDFSLLDYLLNNFDLLCDKNILGYTEYEKEKISELISVDRKPIKNMLNKQLSTNIYKF